MTDRFEIRVNEWLEGAHGTPAERASLALIQLFINGECVTEVADIGAARSLRSSVRVSAYWLAYWFAANWWRLAYETVPPLQRYDARWIDWRQSHQLPGIGHGFLWPPVEIASLNGALVIGGIERTANPPDVEPLRYLAHLDEQFVSFDSFQTGVDAFVRAVLMRLNGLDINSELHEIWQVVMDERADAVSSSVRRREALLGFDPDDVPAALLAFLAEKGHTIGQAAVDEIASAARIDSVNEIDRISASLENNKSIQMHVGDSKRMRDLFQRETDTKEPPWEQGIAAARVVRRYWGLDGKPISRRAFAEKLGLPQQRIQASGLERGPVVAVGVRDACHDDELKMLLHSRNPHGQRFEIARIIADHVFIPVDESWRPITNMRTTRQQFQRAFAAEFLAPVHALRAELEGSKFVSADDIEDLANKFDVNPPVVENQLVDDAVISQADLTTIRRGGTARLS
jgi:hypothetical protein